MGRISAKTLFWFLLCSFLALLLAGCVGYGTYSMGLFNTRIEGLAEASGSTGSNPLNVVLNIIPSNIITAFGSNGAVLSSVFLAVAIGLSMNTLGESRTATLRRLLGEVNDVVVVFLNFIVSNFAPFAVFVLLTRTFAIYGIDYLKPALVYVVVTVVLLLAFLIIAYPLVIALGAKLDPFTFIRKIANVAVFGFSTSSSAATLPLNIKVCEEEFGVDESIASFVLPLGMTCMMAVPSMLIVAPSGRTNALISGSAPILLQHSMFSGSVALEDVVVNAQIMAGARPLKNLSGFMPDRKRTDRPYTTTIWMM